METTIPLTKAKRLLAGSSKSLAEAAHASEELGRIKARLQAAIEEVVAVAEEAVQLSEAIAQNRQNAMDLLRAGGAPAFTEQDRAYTLASLEVLLATLDQLQGFTSRPSVPLPALPDLTRVRDFAVDHLAELQGGWPWLDAAEQAEDLEAARLASTITLSNEELRALATKHPPQQSWYEEKGKPF